MDSSVPSRIYVRGAAVCGCAIVATDILVSLVRRNIFSSRVAAQLARTSEVRSRGYHSPATVLCVIENLDRDRRRINSMVAPISSANKHHRAYSGLAALPRAATHNIRNKPRRLADGRQRISYQVFAGSADVQSRLSTERIFIMALSETHESGRE